MTYMGFHFVFTIPLLIVMLFFTRKNREIFSKKSLQGMGLLLFLAVTYTTPWDSYLIHQRIWSYKPENVMGTFLLIPYEEFFFFVIQTIIGCLFTALILHKTKAPKTLPFSIKTHRIVAFLVMMALLTTAFLFSPIPDHFRYLSLIGVWAIPVLALQWSLGGSSLMHAKGPWLFCVTALTTYFCLADSFAIYKEIWFFPTNTLSGFQLGVLPIEEALFFLVTNLMVVQGYILFTRVDFRRLT